MKQVLLAVCLVVVHAKHHHQKGDGDGYTCNFSSEPHVKSEASYVLPDQSPNCGWLLGDLYAVQISVTTDCGWFDCSTMDVYMGFDGECDRFVGTIDGDNKETRKTYTSIVDDTVCIRIVNQNSMYSATPAIQVMIYSVPSEEEAPLYESADTDNDAEELPVMVFLDMADYVYDLEKGPSVSRNSYLLERYGFVVAETMQSKYATILKDDSYLPAIAVWTRENPKQAVLAIKGTTPTDTTDDRADVWSIVGSSEFTAALNRVSELKRKYEGSLGYTVLVTGHSLGGNLAELASTHFDIPGIAFHGPAPGGSNGDYSNDKFININAEHDKIGNEGDWLKVHVGIVVQETGLESLVFASHGTEAIREWWDSHGSSNMLLTNVNIYDFCKMDGDGNSKRCLLPGREQGFRTPA